MNQKACLGGRHAVLLASLALVIGQSACGGGGGGAPTGTGGGGGAAGSQGNGGAGGFAGTGGGNGGNGGAGGGSVIPPGTFGLVSPVQGSSAQPLTPTLQWDAATDAQSYMVEVATADTFGTADVISVQSSDALTTSYSVPDSMLLPGVIYYWRVTAVNTGGSTVATGAPQRFSSPYLVRGAHGLAVTPNGAELVVASDVNNGPIDIINLTSHAVTDSVSTGVASQPMGIAISPDGTEALATMLTNGVGGVNGVAVVDLTTRSLAWNVSDPCVGTTLSDVAYFPSGTLAAMPDLSGGCSAMGLSTFDPDTNPPGFGFVNFSDTNNPTGIAITPDGLTALVTMQLDSRLYRVAFPGGTVSHLSLPSFSSGVAVTPDGTRAVVASSDVEVVTLADGSLTPITLDGDAPNGDFHNVAITSDGSMAVVVGGASVQVISLTSNTVLSHYPAQNGTSVAVSPDGTTAFVSDSGDGWVRVVQIP
jgi:DNA-binding beta-propeller fold protein YncE